MIEREVKLAVWPGFSLPPLDGIGPDLAVAPRGEKQQESVYFDVADLRLARAGVTLRHRSDDGWTLKLPRASAVAGGLAREEITVPGDILDMPEELRWLVAAHVRTADLTAVAHLRTSRTRVDLVDPGGATVAEVVEDEVSVLDGEHVSSRFREVEVELREGAPVEVLDQVVERLRAAGAGAPDPVPKVMRALGPRAQLAPELTDRPLGREPSAADVLSSGLTRSARRLLEHDPGVPLGEDPEAVHQARVATRRLRSDLRTYGALLDPTWTRSLRDELKWLADALGEVRDADVLGLRLRRQLDALRRADRVVGTALLEVLAVQREAARGRLLEAYRSDRYLALLERVVAAASAPVTLPEGDAPAADVLLRLMVGPWNALEKAARHLTPGSPEAEYHAVRIRAKRARYACDVVALTEGKPARRLGEEVGRVQDVLGEHQDACVAREWLRRVANEVSPAVAFVAGELAAVQDREAALQREAFPHVWRKASRKKLRPWLTP